MGKSHRHRKTPFAKRFSICYAFGMKHTLATARERAQLSQEALAAMVGCSRMTIIRIEARKHLPSIPMIGKIITAMQPLGVEMSADDFMVERAG